MGFLHFSHICNCGLCVWRSIAAEAELLFHRQCTCQQQENGKTLFSASFTRTNRQTTKAPGFPPRQKKGGNIISGPSSKGTLKHQREKTGIQSFRFWFGAGKRCSSSFLLLLRTAGGKSFFLLLLLLSVLRAQKEEEGRTGEERLQQDPSSPSSRRCRRRQWNRFEGSCPPFQHVTNPQRRHKRYVKQIMKYFFFVGDLMGRSEMCVLALSLEISPG